MNRFPVLMIPLALAACTPVMSAADPATLNNPDFQFAQAATGSNLFEIQSSQLALTHSTSAPVRAFAQMLIADHTNAQTQLASLSQTCSSISAPPFPSTSED
ncbi:DUF4142 domain-containing protein [Deinococcus sp.]|uniref:DUF4142 domain-containing protein n=1 Tax=Deinococcus sp. TaxID=47478 RepID=UPI003CC5E921